MNTVDTASRLIMQALNNMDLSCRKNFWVKIAFLTVSYLLAMWQRYLFLEPVRETVEETKNRCYSNGSPFSALCSSLLFKIGNSNP